MCGARHAFDESAPRGGHRLLAWRRINHPTRHHPLSSSSLAPRARFGRLHAGHLALALSASTHVLGPTAKRAELSESFRRTVGCPTAEITLGQHLSNFLRIRNWNKEMVNH